jgi:putative transcriptional regulator
MREKLRHHRILKGLTQEQISGLIGINRATYTNIELGNKNPSLFVAIKIKEILEYENDDIFLNKSIEK